jgi:hypothetical protein
MSNVEGRHLDVLQNIEFAIVQVYRAEPALIYLDVISAVDALVRHYSAEANRRQAPESHLADRPARVFAAVKEMCEWRLGRGDLGDLAERPPSLLPMTGLIECLRRIQKSVRRWNRQGGRRGYLDFVSQYIV